MAKYCQIGLLTFIAGLSQRRFARKEGWGLQKVVEGLISISNLREGVRIVLGLIYLIPNTQAGCWLVLLVCIYIPLNNLDLLYKSSLLLYRYYSLHLNQVD
jgi:hypothetical protein